MFVNATQEQSGVWNQVMKEYLGNVAESDT